MISKSFYLPIFLIGLMSSVVYTQRAALYINSGNKANIEGSVTLICPNGAVLITNYFTDSFRADQNLPSWYDCQPSFMDGTDGIVTLNVSMAYGGTPYTFSVYKSFIFTNGAVDFAGSSLAAIGFQFLSDGRLMIAFLGPSCGNNVREYLLNEECDDDNDPNCLFCGCKMGTFGNYNDFSDPTCSYQQGSTSSNYDGPGILIGIIVPVGVIALVLIIVLRVLCIKGVIGRRRINAAMDMEIRQQQAVEGQQVIVIQEGIVPLDQGVQPGQQVQYPNYASPYSQVPAANQYVPPPQYSTEDPNAQPYSTTNYTAQPVVAQVAPNNNYSANNNNASVVVTPPPPGGAFSTN